MTATVTYSFVNRFTGLLLNTTFPISTQADPVALAYNNAGDIEVLWTLPASFPEIYYGFLGTPPGQISIGSDGDFLAGAVDPAQALLIGGNQAIVVSYTLVRTFQNPTSDIDQIWVLYNGLRSVRVDAGTAPDTESSVAALSNGGFVVTWTSAASATDNNLLFQTFDASANAQHANPLVVDSDTTISTSHSSVAALSGGGFVVAWEQTPVGGGTPSVWFQRFANDGSLQAGHVNVDTGASAGSIMTDAHASALPDGGFVVVYTSDEWQLGGTEITYRVYNADGSPRSGVLLANTSTVGNQDKPSIAVLPNGDFVVSWTDESNATSGYQAFDPSGNKLGSEQHLDSGVVTNFIVAISGTSIGSVIGAVYESTAPGPNGSAESIRVSMNELAHSSIGTGAAETIVGFSDGVSDFINGKGGADTITGGADPDIFAFDSTAIGSIAHITDYDMGNTPGIYNAAEYDQIDLTALLSAAYNDGSGQTISSLVRAEVTGTGATLLVDPDGAANGSTWTPIAVLDGIHAGETVNVILDTAILPGIRALAAGSNIPVIGAATPDFNLDLTSDILFRNDNGAVATWDMNDHTFTGFDFTSVVGPVPTDWHIAGKGDFNGDGITDILWRDDNGDVATWDMNDHTFTGFVFSSTGNTVSNDWKIAGTGDFNGDGKTDILWRNDNGDVATWDMNDHTFTGFAFSSTGNTVSNDWQIVGTGDFNGDGKTDILWRNDNGNLAAWLMNDHSYTGFDFASVGDVVPAGWNIVGTGDFNGDGKTDILWRGPNGEVSTWDMNDSASQTDHFTGHPLPWDGIYERFTGFTFTTVPLSWTVAGTGDYNGDGKTDILWRNTDGAIATWDMNDHTFTGFDFTSSGVVVPTSWHIA